MSLTLKKRGDYNRPLQFEEVDNNWALIEQAINKINGNAKSLIKTLEEGENMVEHALGSKARFVTFFMANGQQVEFEWWRKSDDQDNKIIVYVPEKTPARQYTDLEINIQAI